jgi:ankyrin repeat protein
LYRPIIEAAIFSEFVSDTFIDNLSCAFKLEVVMPGNDIIVQDDASSAMYFIVSGSAETIHSSVSESPNDEIEDDFENVNIPKRKSLTDLLKSLDLESIRSKANQSRIKKYFINSLGIGSAIGEVSFFFNLLQPFSVRTSKISRLLILRKDDWLKLEPSYPIDTTLCKKSCFNNVISQIKQLREPGHKFTSSAVIDREIMEIYNDLERDMFYAESQWEHDKIAELCLAAAADNIVVIKRILICGINVNSSDYDKRNPLMVAASKGSLNAVRYLLDKGADVSLVDVFNNSALYEAVRNGHDTCASILYENGSRLSDSIDVYAAGSLLCTAISKGDHSGLMRLLQYGLNSNSGDYDQRRALHIAAATGDLRSVKILLDNGADASCLDNFGRTPLIEAVRAGHNSVAKLLYDRGAKLGFLDTERENVKLERDALTSKADITWKCRILTSSELVTCASRLDANYLRMLLQFGANPNKAFDYDLRTPAHLAVCMNSVELCTLLLEHKADFASDYSKDRWGNTPLDEAKKYGYTWLFDTITNLIKITNSEEIVDI